MTDGRTDEWTDVKGWMDGKKDGWTDRRMDGWTDGLMVGQKDGRTPNRGFRFLLIMVYFWQVVHNKPNRNRNVTVTVKNLLLLASQRFSACFVLLIIQTQKTEYSILNIQV
jgi:hypothetical protein